MGEARQTPNPPPTFSSTSPPYHPVRLEQFPTPPHLHNFTTLLFFILSPHSPPPPHPYLASFGLRRSIPNNTGFPVLSAQTSFTRRRNSNSIPFFFFRFSSFTRIRAIHSRSLLLRTSFGEISSKISVSSSPWRFHIYPHNKGGSPNHPSPPPAYQQLTENSVKLPIAENK